MILGKKLRKALASLCLPLIGSVIMSIPMQNILLRVWKKSQNKTLLLANQSSQNQNLFVIDFLHN